MDPAPLARSRASTEGFLAGGFLRSRVRSGNSTIVVDTQVLGNKPQRARSAEPTIGRGYSSATEVLEDQFDILDLTGTGWRLVVRNTFLEFGAEFPSSGKADCRVNSVSTCSDGLSSVEDSGTGLEADVETHDNDDAISIDSATESEVASKRLEPLAKPASSPPGSFHSPAAPPGQFFQQLPKAAASIVGVLAVPVLADRYDDPVVIARSSTQRRFMDSAAGGPPGAFLSEASWWKPGDAFMPGLLGGGASSLTRSTRGIADTVSASAAHITISRCQEELHWQDGIRQLDATSSRLPSKDCSWADVTDCVA